MTDIINDTIVNLKNHERKGKSQCTIKPVSKLLIDVLGVFQKEGYIGQFEVSEDKTGGSVRVNLVKRINECGIIKPRYSVSHTEFDTLEKRFLPAKDFGTIVVTTPKGVMSHKDAKKKNLGGKLIAYVY